MASMEWIEPTLEVLRIVVSWPVAAVVIAFLFRNAIRSLLNRIRVLSVPGVQLQTRQLPEGAAPGEREIKPPAPQLPEGLALSPEQQAILRQAFQAERAAARLWEYRYLNYFLARSTQTVLDWLVNLGQATTYDAYDAYWLAFITDANQRRIIIDVLQAHHLIELDGQIIRATEKAREYVNWRGPLPPLPAPSPLAPPS